MIRRAAIPLVATPLCLLAAGVAQAQVIISGVIDGPLTGGIPKAIELYATQDVPDLSIYGVGSANNGGGSDGEEFTLSGSAVAGQFIYVASEDTAFETFLGFAPNFVSSAAAINGDDAIELFENGVVIDVFGDINVDGSGQPWEYLDGWAYRSEDSNPVSADFVLDDWVFSGPNALDGFATNADAGVPFPNCSFAPGVFDVTGCEGTPDDPDDPGGEVPVTDLIITGVVDGPLSGGTPKAIELLATADIADLSAYGLGSANNGGGTDGQEVTLSGSAVAGQFIYVASEMDQFEAFFSFAPDFTSGAAAINGDDAIELFLDGVVVDTFGEIDVDGSGEPWEYLDGWGYRSDGSSANPAFMIADWFFSGPNALDGEVSNMSAATPFPACSYALPGVETSGCDVVIDPPVEDLLCAAPNDAKLPIFDVQSARHVSPLVAGAATDAEFYTTLPNSTSADEVLIQGVVTAVDSNGFYLQDPVGDGDDATSDALFVFTNSAPAVAVGDVVAVRGPVQEFFPGGTSTRNLSTTQLRFSELEVCSSGNDLPAPVVLGTSGRTPPTKNIDPDVFTVFDPANDGLDFFESLEGMLVTIEDAVAVAPTSRFGEIFALANGGTGSLGSGFSARGTANIAPDDFNPERLQIDEDTGIAPIVLPDVKVGAQLGSVTGVVGYSFGNFEVYPTVDFLGNVIPSSLEAETSGLSGGALELAVASYNVLNLDPEASDGDDDAADGRFTEIAAHVATNLNAPDIIGLQEVQDNSGSINDATVSASATLAKLVEEILAAGGPQYAFIDNIFITDGRSGGQPGGNIRTAFLYNPARVVPLGDPEPVGNQDPGSAFEGARLPFAATFFFNGAEVTVVNNHFSSKGGSAPIFGIAQDFTARQEDPTVNGSVDERQAQSAEIQAFVAALLTEDAEAPIVVLGDLNEFEFVSPVVGLEAAGLRNLTGTLAEDERYSFIFQGNSQSLDHILVSERLWGGAQLDAVHVNVEFPERLGRASDHDPLLATLLVEPSATSPDTLEALLDGALANGSIEGIANNERTRGQKVDNFRRYLERIQFWNEAGRTADECNWAGLGLKRVDGLPSPSDLVSGPAAPILAGALREYLDANCN